MEVRRKVNHLSRCSDPFVIDLKVEMKPPAKNVYRLALGIVSGIADELIVEADIHIGDKSVFVIFDQCPRPGS